MRADSIRLLLVSVLAGCVAEPTEVSGWPAADGPADVPADRPAEPDGAAVEPLGDPAAQRWPSPPAEVGGQGALPCEIDAVLEAHCRTCHADPPRYGAPMPLASWSQLHAPSRSDPSRPVFELVKDRLADTRRPMPPTADLPEAERALLDRWLASSAPAEASAACDAPEVAAPEFGPEALPCTPTHVITAHAAGSTRPFQVPPEAGNLYECFTLRSPFGPTTQATAWAPVIDDERVVHHWILYGTRSAQPDGGVGPCRMPADARFITGWAPGGGNWIMPDDVSLELPGPDEWLILQIHYHNDAWYTDALDASGVALCTTETPRPNVAGFVSFGSVRINIPAGATGHAVTGECSGLVTSFLPEPLTLLASFPHMHRLGRSFQSEILRRPGSGPPETLLAVPRYDFESQRAYPHDPPVMLHPGDGVRTTCVYDNPTSRPVTFGERTEDEMCLDFVMLYPITAVGSNRSCGLF